MEHVNLENLTKEISDLLFDSQILCETLAEIDDLGRQKGGLVDMINKNIKKAFEDVEACRKLISVPN